jgi:hypothetical protein
MGCRGQGGPLARLSSRAYAFGMVSIRGPRMCEDWQRTTYGPPTPPPSRPAPRSPALALLIHPHPPSSLPLARSLPRLSAPATKTPTPRLRFSARKAAASDREASNYGKLESLASRESLSLYEMESFCMKSARSTGDKRSVDLRRSDVRERSWTRQGRALAR